MDIYSRETPSILVKFPSPCCRLTQSRYPRERSQFDLFTVVTVTVTVLHPPTGRATSVWGKYRRASSLARPHTKAEHAHDTVVEKNHGGEDAKTDRQVWGRVQGLCARGRGGRRRRIVRVDRQGVRVHRHYDVLEGHSSTRQERSLAIEYSRTGR